MNGDDGVEGLRRAALEARGRAHAPYSHFQVGAALESDDGRIFGGCNVENASYPVTICAERVALGTAVAAGASRFRRLFLCSSSEDPIPPCGMCRQALSEFAPELEIVSEGRSGARLSWRLAELLPAHFELEGTRGETGSSPGGAEERP